MIRVDIGPFDTEDEFAPVVDVLLAIMTAIPEGMPAPIILIVDDAVDDDVVDDR